MANVPKKFLDSSGLTYFASLLNNYPTNNVLQAVINAIDQVKADKTDIVNSDWNATSGVAEILNKPTIPNVPAWALTSAKPTYTASEVGATTTSDVNGLIASAIGNINSFDVAIVSTLPTTDISTHTIYFMANSASGNNVYDEYMYINGNWELLGSTTIDLSNYLQKTDIAAWAKASTKPSYTANEVGAVPINGNGGMILNAVAGTIQGQGLFLSSSSIAFQKGSDSYTTTGIASHTSGLRLFSGSGPSNTTNLVRVMNVASPTDNADAANKQYVDNAIANFTYTETDPTVPAWAKAASKPTYTAAEVGALPDTTVIPAAQVNADWNATSGVAQILNKPTIPAATTVTQVLTSGTVIATINGTNIYAPSYTDADGVSY